MAADLRKHAERNREVEESVRRNAAFIEEARKQLQELNARLARELRNRELERRV